jgi:hypothetical protein
MPEFRCRDPKASFQNSDINGLGLILWSIIVYPSDTFSLGSPDQAVGLPLLMKLLNERGWAGHVCVFVYCKKAMRFLHLHSLD